MIFVAAGTADGRALAAFLLEAGFPVTASVVSGYGEKLLKRYPGLRVNDKPLDEDGLTRYIEENEAEVLVDASHPYARDVSVNAMAAARRAGIAYIRYERESVAVSYDKAYCVASYEEAAAKAASLGKNIFLTTGSRNLEKFVNSPALSDCSLTARILPTAKVLAQCEAMGLTPKNIIAIEGPFSTELNEALYRQYAADVIVMKDSGQVGGTDTKIAAAMNMNLPVVMIARPALVYDNIAYTFEDVLSFVRDHTE